MTEATRDGHLEYLDKTLLNIFFWGGGQWPPLPLCRSIPEFGKKKCFCYNTAIKFQAVLIFKGGKKKKTKQKQKQKKTKNKKTKQKTEKKKVTFMVFQHCICTH